MLSLSTEPCILLTILTLTAEKRHPTHCSSKQDHPSPRIPRSSQTDSRHKTCPGIPGQSHSDSNGHSYFLKSYPTDYLSSNFSNDYLMTSWYRYPSDVVVNLNFSDSWDGTQFWSEIHQRHKRYFSKLIRYLLPIPMCFYGPSGRLRPIPSSMGFCCSNYWRRRGHYRLPSPASGLRMPNEPVCKNPVQSDNSRMRCQGHHRPMWRLRLTHLLDV